MDAAMIIDPRRVLETLSKVTIQNSGSFGSADQFASGIALTKLGSFAFIDQR